MSVIYYQFRSAKRSDIMKFDGAGISVFDLKKEVMLAKRLGKGIDIDLHIYDAQTEQGREPFECLHIG